MRHQRPNRRVFPAAGTVAPMFAAPRPAAPRPAIIATFHFETLSCAFWDSRISRRNSSSSMRHSLMLGSARDYRHDRAVTEGLHNGRRRRFDAGAPRAGRKTGGAGFLKEGGLHLDK